MLIFLRIALIVFPLLIAIFMAGFQNHNLRDYLLMLQLQAHQPNWFNKVIVTQVTVYVCLFYSVLIVIGEMIKEPVSKKLVIFSTILLTVFCLTSTYFLMQLHKDLEKFDLLLCSSAFAITGLLFTCDAVITTQQIIATSR
ncbi:uncharacterized protein LOC126841338 [Adelges cooleyi]|uniref:uncharacterized protein LOC126841338 n=1 Tax=Adelges cooleyi TaxID=133065 RepID=UPI00217F9A2E|nr:uncharacterized protein LOC126841338 [Adelges cooleyi]